MQGIVLLPMLLFVSFFCPELVSGTSYAQALPAGVIRSLNQAQIPATAVSTYVAEVTMDGHSAVPLINWQSDVPLQPASVMKLVTSYAALSLLGPAYHWNTAVYMHGYLDGDVLHGDVIIRGAGDPKLVPENFWLMLRQLRASGIRQIDGNVVVDSAWMEMLPYDPAVFDGHPDRPYNAGADPFLVNYNVLSLQLHDELSGLRVTTDTPVALESDVNVRRVAGACGEWRDKMTANFSLAGQKLHLSLSGEYAKSCGDQHWIVQPYTLNRGEFAGAVFRQLWAEVGGQFSGQFIARQQFSDLPPDVTLLMEWRSPPLADILRDMNKFSNNVMARNVFLTLANDAVIPLAENENQLTRAARRVQVWLAGLGIDNRGLVIENGSGLSRTARISALQLGGMLAHAYDSAVMPEFIASLPVLGVDGTMKKRLAGQAVAGHAHIKSGTLEQVSAIAGYVLSASGKRYVVVCLINHESAAKGTAVQDALLAWIYEHG